MDVTKRDRQKSDPDGVRGDEQDKFLYDNKTIYLLEIKELKYNKMALIS